jgi:hypothetical protein
MKPFSRKLRNLFNALKITYREQSYPPPDDRWQDEVMRRIDHLASSAFDGTLFQMIEQVTWRLTPVTFSMILICAMALMQLETIPDWQVFQLLTAGMEEINMADIFI